jgi:hypothetical protein
MYNRILIIRNYRRIFRLRPERKKQVKQKKEQYKASCNKKDTADPVSGTTNKRCDLHGVSD